MTDEQRKLCEDNHNLIYHFLHKYNLPIDEWYDMAAIGLCKAATSYNDELSKFSTYAMNGMYMTVFCEKRKEKSLKAIPYYMMMYHQEKTTTKEGEDVGELIDCLASNENIEENVTFQVVYNNACEKLCERDKTILKMMIDGYSQEKIANGFALSQPQISRIMKKIKNHLMKEMC